MKFWSEGFQKALEIPEEGRKTLRRIANQRKQQRKLMEEDRRRQKEAARQAHQERQREAMEIERKLWEQAQTHLT
jgi:hypothetical protein